MSFVFVATTMYCLHTLLVYYQTIFNLQVFHSTPCTLYFSTSWWQQNIYNFKVVTVGHVTRHFCIIQHSHTSMRIYHVILLMLPQPCIVYVQSGHSGSRHTTLLHHPAQPHLNADISCDFVDVATTVYCLCLLYYHNMVAFHSHQLTPCYHTTCLPILLLAPSSLTPQVHTSPAFFPIHAFIFISSTSSRCLPGASRLDTRKVHQICLLLDITTATLKVHINPPFPSLFGVHSLVLLIILLYEKEYFTLCAIPQPPTSLIYR